MNECSWCLTQIESSDGFSHQCTNSVSPIIDEPATPTGPTHKDPQVAFALELIPGIAGFLGIGWAYSTSRRTGIFLMISWGSVFATLMLTLAWIARNTGTIGVLAVLPFVMTVGVGIPIYSALRVKRRIDQVSVTNHTHQ